MSTPKNKNKKNKRIAVTWHGTYCSQNSKCLQLEVEKILSVYLPVDIGRINEKGIGSKASEVQYESVGE